MHLEIRWPSWERDRNEGPHVTNVVYFDDWVKDVRTEPCISAALLTTSSITVARTHMSAPDCQKLPGQKRCQSGPEFGGLSGS